MIMMRLEDLSDQAWCDLRDRIEDYVKSKLIDDFSGHDWWHTDRVREVALQIQSIEGGCARLVEATALLHDVEDWKISGDVRKGPRTIRSWLERQGVARSDSEAIGAIVLDMSFKGGAVPDTELSLEGCIVRDADRLDALGAIGIARLFAYAGFFRQPIHDPRAKPRLASTTEEYASGDTTAFNHIFEKILQIVDRMKTETGRRMAEERHRFTVLYARTFLREWGLDEPEGCDELLATDEGADR